MKRCWIGLCLFALFFTVYLSIAWAKNATGPKIVLEEKSADYKEVDQGDIIEHTFKVLNEGDQLLEIKSVKPG